MGWATMYYEQSHGFSISTTKKCILTLKSVILKTSESQMKIRIVCDKDDSFGSSSRAYTFFVSLKKDELNKFVNVIIPGVGINFGTTTKITSYGCEFSDKTPCLSASHILKGKTYNVYSLYANYYAIHHHKRVIKPTVDTLAPPYEGCAYMHGFTFSSQKFD